MIYLAVYLVIVNVFAFFLFGADKRKAKKGQWRISEKALFLSAIVGGSLGAIAGMQFFRHKTQHWYFKYGIPAILIVQAVVLWLIFK